MKRRLRSRLDCSCPMCAYSRDISSLSVIIQECIPCCLLTDSPFQVHINAAFMQWIRAPCPCCSHGSRYICNTLRLAQTLRAYVLCPDSRPAQNRVRDSSATFQGAHVDTNSCFTTDMESTDPDPSRLLPVDVRTDLRPLFQHHPLAHRESQTLRSWDAATQACVHSFRGPATPQLECYSRTTRVVLG